MLLFLDGVSVAPRSNIIPEQAAGAPLCPVSSRRLLRFAQLALKQNTI
jgi:hypothetical protein